jgi:6-phosphofructokinase 1
MVPRNRVAIVTSGGDAPGMNAAVREVVATLVARGASPWGVHHGFAGLARRDWEALGPADIDGIEERPGTILGSARSEAFRFVETVAETAIRMKASGLDRLIAIGGNGTQRGGDALRRHGISVVGIASTIDNDVPGIHQSIGATTAAATVLEAVERLRATARSHRRVALVETMGRASGWLALSAGIAGCADAIVAPELCITPEMVGTMLSRAWSSGRRGLVVVAAEGAGIDIGRLAHHLETVTSPGWETRSTVLGHVQRGARPCLEDRLLGRRAGAAAAAAILTRSPRGIVGARDGRCGVLVAPPEDDPNHPINDLIQLAPRIEIT